MKGKERKQNSKIPTWNEYFKNVTHMKKKTPQRNQTNKNQHENENSFKEKLYTRKKYTHTHTQLDEDSIFEIKIDMK